MSVQGDIAAALVSSLQAVVWTATADAVTVETKNFPSYDIEDLGEEVRARVAARFGVTLRWEIRRIGLASIPVSGSGS